MTSTYAKKDLKIALPTEEYKTSCYDIRTCDTEAVVVIFETLPIIWTRI